MLYPFEFEPVLVRKPPTLFANRLSLKESGDETAGSGKKIGKPKACHVMFGCTVLGGDSVVFTLFLPPVALFLPKLGPYPFRAAYFLCS